MEKAIIIMKRQFYFCFMLKFQWASGSFQFYLPSLGCVRYLRIALGHRGCCDPCLRSEVVLGWGHHILWGMLSALGSSLHLICSPPRPPPSLDVVPPGRWQGCLKPFIIPSPRTGRQLQLGVGIDICDP